ncbi:MAG: hypothetical protein K6E10_01930 [Eubacterium sp.]|nr:hypothetical protein [Eubacterium sp.]
MLEALHTKENRIPQPIYLRDLDFDKPFYEGLQYNPPARGTWNIVHTGMLIPEAHQIYVCAQGCLRGVILTAAEMMLMDRMSWVSLREKDMWNGEMESRVIEGVAHIVEQMDHRPPCVLVYLSCMHMFEGCDFNMIAGELMERFPGTYFVDCYMTPTMRKTMSPDAMMKNSLYAPVQKLEVDNDLIGLVGCDRETDKTSDIYSLAQMAGKKVWEINSCKTYKEYLDLGRVSHLISYLPVANSGVGILSKRIERPWTYAPLSYDKEEIIENLKLISQALGIDTASLDQYIEKTISKADKAMVRAKEIIGDTPIVIDYSASPRSMGLALLLTEYGMNVEAIYSDVFLKDERPAYQKLLSLKPDIKIYPTLDPAMRFADNQYEGTITDKPEILAIGQKAAYFVHSPYFVNIADGGGMYGLDGIRRMAEQIIEAFQNPKDTKKTISHKGIGCDSCLT